MTPLARPLGVSVLAALAMIGAAVGLLAVTAATASGDPAVLSVGLPMAILYGLTAYGLWTLRSWAWPLALIAWTLGTLDAIRQLTDGTLNTNLVVGPLVVLYLLQPGIRRQFSR